VVGRYRISLKSVYLYSIVALRVSCAIKVVVGIVLLLSVLVIFTAPAVDLEPTALRAMQAASLLFAVLALAGTTIAAMLTPFNPSFGVVFGFHPIETGSASLVDLNCVRLC
jgi:ABC-type Mn2+/Zn2+ transport system permease subunit